MVLEIVSSTFDTNFKTRTVHNSTAKFDINPARVMNELPSIEQNFPTRDNLRFFKNTADLVKNNKFPKLADIRLNLIIGVRQAELINYEKLRKAANPGEPFVGLCYLGWVIFGLDSYLKCKPMTCCNFVRVLDDMLEKKSIYYYMNPLLKGLMILIKHLLLMIKSF